MKSKELLVQQRHFHHLFLVLSAIGRDGKKNEVREGRHDPSGQKEGHVKALKQQTACHIPCKGLGYKVGGSTKDDLTGTGRRDQGFYRLVRGFCLHPKSKRKPLEV